MTKLNKLFILLLSAATLLSCQKDYNPYDAELTDPNIINNLQGFLKCNINGSAFNTEFQEAYLMPVEGTGYKALTINATKYDDIRHKDAYQSLSFTIAVYEGPKWYNVNYPASASYVQAFKDNPTTTYVTSSSDEEQYVEITDDDGKFISGKFRIKVTMVGGSPTEITDFTEGEFKVPIMNR